jgi:flagellar biosynthesis/type III secretory pathway protein FliH
MAPPLREVFEGPTVRLSVPPERDATSPPSVHPPVETALPEPPPPPPYPDLRIEHAALEAECAAMRLQLKAIAEATVELKRRILEESEPQLVRLACTIGERIAARELSSDPSLVVGWAREAIAELASDDPMVVAVSPDIAAALNEASWAPVVSPSVRIETDGTLIASSCEVRSRRATVDASLRGRAAAVAGEVQGASSGSGASK